MENVWELYGKYMKIGNVWKIYGKCMGNVWEMYDSVQRSAFCMNHGDCLLTGFPPAYYITTRVVIAGDHNTCCNEYCDRMLSRHVV